MTIHEIFGCLCLPYGRGFRPCVECAWVMPSDRNAETPTFGAANAKTVWELASDLTFTAVTA